MKTKERMSKNFSAQIHYYGLMALVITLPFYINVNSIVIILLVINWLYALISGSIEIKVRQRWIAVFFIGFYILDVFSLFYSSDLPESLHNLEKKLAFLIIPLLLAFSFGLKKQQYEMIFFTFAGACLAGVAYCFVMAVYKFSFDNDPNHFFYHNLSHNIDIHAVYFSFYLCFSIFILIYFLSKYWNIYHLPIKLIFAAVILVFLSSLFFFASKAILAAITLISNCILLWILIARKRFYAFFILLLINILLTFLFFQFKKTQDRFVHIMDYNIGYVFKDKLTYEENNALNGISLRILQVKYVFEILNEQKAWVWGVGIGNAQTLMDEKYKKSNLYVGAAFRGDKGYLGYNVHNQYFENLLRIGLIGAIYFLVYLIVSFRIAIKRKSFLHLILLIFFSLLCFSESMLEANKGIVFFTFFNSFFIFQRIGNEEVYDK